MPIPKEQRIFECQLKIVSEYNRPIIMHVSLARGKLFQSSKHVQQSNEGLHKHMHFHVFSGKSQMAYEQLVKYVHAHVVMTLVRRYILDLHVL